MEDKLALRITGHPAYQELRRSRTRLGILLTVAMMVVYYGFILLVAFDKPLLASPIGAGAITLGMPLGVGVILFTIVVTVVYVRRANTHFDALTEQVKKAVL